MWRVWCLVAAVALAGCGSKGDPNALPVNGIVTMDDAPFADATVTFWPAEKNESGGGLGTTSSDGKFIVSGMKGEKGLAPGRYKVTVSRMKLPGGAGDPPVGAITEADIAHDLPAIYSVPDKTILTFTVTGDGKPIEIKLSSKKK